MSKQIINLLTEKSGKGEKQGVYPPPAKLFYISLLTLNLFGFVLFPAKGQTNLPSNIRAIWYDCSSDTANLADEIESIPDKFMSEPNQVILQNVKRWGYNYIFMNVSLLNVNDSATIANLGLNPYPGYKEKMVDFIHKADSMNIKVYAVPAIANHWIFPEYKNKALKKVGFLAFYQNNIKMFYPNKNCHFNGVATNIEPWAIKANSCNECSQQGYHWEPNMCSGTNRQNNNIVAQHYLNLIPDLWNKLTDNHFFSPYNCTQNLDKLFMGTVHWNWHYFSQWHKNGNNYFPNGNYSLYVGIRNGKHYFDILLPETYCSKDGDQCMNNPCVDVTVNTLCENSSSEEYGEKTGGCYQWFKKHFVDKDFYAGHSNMTYPIVMPIDAAPMLYGHAAHMFSSICALYSLRENAKIYTINCSLKPNYKGSFIYEYQQNLALNQTPCSPALINCELPADGDNDNINISANAEIGDKQVIQSRYKFQYFPNPADEYVSFGELQSGEYIRIIDNCNNIKIETRHSPINTSALNSGIYFIQRVSADGVILYSDRLIINHLSK